MPIPIILGEVTFNRKSVANFQFEYNNCDGGSWETVVFPTKNGTLVFVTFNTPTIAGAKPRQVALAGITTGNHFFIHGIDGTFNLSNATLDSHGKSKKSLQGSLILDEEFLDQKSGALSMASRIIPIDMKGISFSRPRPFSYDSMLSDLRSIPKLEKATLKKMCKDFD